VVVFADADAAGPGPFTFREVEPEAAVGFSSHSVLPGALVTFARELFGARAPPFVPVPRRRPGRAVPDPAGRGHREVTAPS